MSAKNWQEIRVTDDTSLKTVATKLNEANRSINDELDSLTARRRFDINKLFFEIGAAVTTIIPAAVTFRIKPAAIVVGRVFNPLRPDITYETVNSVHWIPSVGNEVIIKAINGVVANASYQITLVAYE